MQASLVRITDPFRPHVGRQVHRLSRRTRVDTLLRRHGLIAGRGRRMRRLSNFVVAIGPNNYLMQDQWARAVADGDVLTIIAVPAGGGALRMVALVAVAVLSAYTGGAAGALYGAGWGAAAAVGVTIAGTMLVNALLPLPKAATGSADNKSGAYGIGSAGNQAKLGSPIPVQYGHFRTQPNFAAQPYTEYDSNYQYLYSLYCIGQGEYELDEGGILIGDTPIDNYAEVQYEVIPPGGAVTLFPTNVATSADVSSIALKKPADMGEGDTEWSGPYAVSAPGTKSTQIIIDTGYPQGLYRVNDEGKQKTANNPWVFEAQLIDDNGAAIGAWVTLEQANEWLSDNTPGIYTTRRYNVAAGRYQVRMKRLTPGTGGGTVVDAFYWLGLRAVLVEDAPKYGNVTLLAVQIKATNNINQSTSNQVYVSCTRKLPIWNGSSWSAPTATRSIAWAAADVLRNTDYGRGWADNRMDLATLLDLDALWASRGDYFDGVFDTKTSLWDALTSVLRAGRTIPMYYAGLIEFVRDQPQTIPTLVLTPDNIVDFQATYAFPTADTPDYVQVTYTDPTTWKDVQVDCALTGSAMQTPASITLMGCTDRAQAYREGMYAAADNRDRRNGAIVTVELEGMIPKYGDLVLLSHDVPAWGLSGQVRAYDAATGVLTLTEPPQWWDGQQAYILLRSRNGGAQGPFKVSPGAGDFQVVLQGLTAEQAAALYISDGVSEEPTIYQLGPGESYAKQMLVTKAEPQQGGQVQLTLINYATTPYTAENDASAPPPPSGSLLINQPTAPAVGGVGISEDPNTQTVMLSVDPIPGAVAYEFQVSYDGGLTWMSVGISTSNTITTSIPAGSWIVRARAISALGVSGPWTQTPVTVTGAPPVLGALTNLTATSGVMSILLTWQLPAGKNLISAEAVELWFGTTSNRAQAQRLATLSLQTNTYTLANLPAGMSLFFWARVRGSDAGNYSPDVGPVNGQSSSDATQILTYLSGQISRTELAQDLLTDIDAAAALGAYVQPPAYDSTKTYAVGDIVAGGGGRLYRALQAVPAGTVPPNAAYWQDVGSAQQTAYGIAAQIYDVNLQLDNLDGDLSVTATKTDGLYAQLNPKSAGELTDASDGSAGNWTTMPSAGYYSYSIAQVRGDLALSQRIDTWSASLSDLSATVQSNALAQVNGDAALGQRIDTVSANVGTVSASVQTNATAIAAVSGKVSSSLTVKTQVAANGQHYLAGIAIGVDYAGGDVTSQVLVNAATFAVFDASSGTAPATYPFVVQGGQAFINQALIGTGWITNAMIGNQIKSTAVNNTGDSTWVLDKAGTLGFNGDEFTALHGSTGFKMTQKSNGVVVMEYGKLS